MSASYKLEQVYNIRMQVATVYHLKRLAAGLWKTGLACPEDNAELQARLKILPYTKPARIRVRCPICDYQAAVKVSASLRDFIKQNQ